MLNILLQDNVRWSGYCFSGLQSPVIICARNIILSIFLKSRVIATENLCLLDRINKCQCTEPSEKRHRKSFLFIAM